MERPTPPPSSPSLPLPLFSSLLADHAGEGRRLAMGSEPFFPPSLFSLWNSFIYPPPRPLPCTGFPSPPLNQTDNERRCKGSSSYFNVSLSTEWPNWSFCDGYGTGASLILGTLLALSFSRVPSQCAPGRFIHTVPNKLIARRNSASPSGFRWGPVSSNARFK